MAREMEERGYPGLVVQLDESQSSTNIAVEWANRMQLKNIRFVVGRIEDIHQMEELKVSLTPPYPFVLSLVILNRR